MKTFNYGGRSYHYESTECYPAFEMEIGRLTNSYKTHALFHNHDDAIAAYEAFQVSNGYKKRLRLHTGILGSTIIAKQISKRGE